LTTSYDDPYFMPPADISGAGARAYENQIVSLLRGELLPSSGPVIFLRSIELGGERPDTEITFHYTDARCPGRQFARRTLLWRDPTYGCWPCDDTPGSEKTLEPAVSVAAAIGSAWYADELELVPPDESGGSGGDDHREFS
jgi:hypothetical protein